MAFNYKTEYERYRKYYQSIEPVLKKPKSSAYTMAIFSFLAISLFGWYGIRPTLQTILFLRREIADNKEVNKRMEDKITHLVEAQAAYQGTVDSLPLIDEALPHDPEVLSLIAQLRNLAAENGGSLSAVQVPSVPILGNQATPSGTTAQAGKLTEIPLVVVITGPYTRLISFLDGLVHMRRIATLKTISMAQTKEEIISGGKIATASGTLLRLVAKINTYYLPAGKK